MLALFPWISVVGTAVTVAAARAFRGKFYAMFAAVLLSVHSLIATALAKHVGEALPVYTALHVLVFVQFLMLE